MDDLISRKAAYTTMTDYYHHTTEMQHKALREALERVPSAETHEKRTETHACDLLSRQAAIDAVNDYMDKSISEKYLPTSNGIIRRIKELPPAQPDVLACGEGELIAQPEIIQCKDCKHRDPEDHKCDCGHDIIWQLPRDDKWYCADAERKDG